MELKEGRKAPNFTLRDAENNRIGLNNFKGKYLALYFYPKDNTSGCTKQSCNLRDNTNLLKKHNIEIVGVSLDDAASHKNFSEKYSLPFPLLCDTQAIVSKKYGVYMQKNMYGNKFWGIKRTTFLIDPKGIIHTIFKKVDVSGHASQILKTLADA